MNSLLLYKLGVNSVSTAFGQKKMIRRSDGEEHRPGSGLMFGEVFSGKNLRGQGFMRKECF